MINLLPKDKKEEGNGPRTKARVWLTFPCNRPFAAAHDLSRTFGMLLMPSRCVEWNFYGKMNPF